MKLINRVLAVMLGLSMVAASCSADESSQTEQGTSNRQVLVTTTSILGDVLENATGGQFEVVTLMPAGSDPHHFQPSAKDVTSIDRASAVIVNGAAFEEGLLSAIEAAEARGVPVYEAISAVESLGAEADDHDEPEHNHDQHGETGLDPHFFTDPQRMANAVDGIVDFLTVTVEDIDTAALRSSADNYITTLEDLDAEVESLLAPIPSSHRVLLTNHAVLSYFADRYEFDVIGTVIPVGNTGGGVSGRRLADLVELIGQQSVSVIFTDISASDALAKTLATEIGDVEVVELYSESLGGPESAGSSYVTMVRSNALRISEALVG